jgi:hypothetical protein
MRSMTTRIATFAAVVVLAVGGAVLYLGHVGRRDAPIRGDQSLAGQVDPAAVSAVLAEPHIVFRSTALGASYGHIAIVPLARPDAAPVLTDLSCDRVYATGSGGVCLVADRGVTTTYRTLLLDASLATVATLPVPGLPSRARSSPDGHWVVTTTFVSGHSYTDTTFSTATIVYDTTTRRSIGNLESFAFVRDGRAYRSVDINVWGVTFAADQRHFYATVKTRGMTHLAAGDLAERRIELLNIRAECPSLSPDGTRIAYKLATGPITWRLHVLDLRTRADVAVAETRSVDDQVEWLDGGHVSYGLPRPGSAQTDVWSVPADGSGTPTRLIADAWSPAIVR